MAEKPGPRKTYVTVLVEIDKEGKKTPKEIVWKDGQHFEVTRVFSVARRAAMKVGGMGIRYEIEVNAHRTYVWEEEDRWFVEEKTG